MIRLRKEWGVGYVIIKGKGNYWCLIFMYVALLPFEFGFL